MGGGWGVLVIVVGLTVASEAHHTSTTLTHYMNATASWSYNASNSNLEAFRLLCHSPDQSSDSDVSPTEYILDLTADYYNGCYELDDDQVDSLPVIPIRENLLGGDSVKLRVCPLAPRGLVERWFPAPNYSGFSVDKILDARSRGQSPPQCSNHPLFTKFCFNFARLWGTILCEGKHHQYVQAYCDEEGPKIGLYGEDDKCQQLQKVEKLDPKRCYSYSWQAENYGPWMLRRTYSREAFRFACDDKNHLKLQHYLGGDGGECILSIPISMYFPKGLCMHTGPEECALWVPDWKSLPPLPPPSPLANQNQEASEGVLPHLENKILLLILFSVLAIFTLCLSLVLFTQRDRLSLPCTPTSKLPQEYDNPVHEKLSTILQVSAVKDMDRSILQAVTTIKEELAELEQSNKGNKTNTMVGVHTSSPYHNKMASTSLKSKDPELAASGAGKPNEMFLLPGSKTGALSPQATIPDRVEVDIQTSFRVIPPPSVTHQINSDAGEKSEVKSEGQDAGPPLPGDVLLGREGKQYQILSSIGQGSSGFLYLAVEAQTKREFAVKVPKTTSGAIRTEYEITALLPRHRFVRTEDLARWEGKECLVMEYCSLKDLKCVVHAASSMIDELTIHKTVLHMAQALVYLHRNGIIHRDVKLENILISNTGGMKLGDFGSSRMGGLARTLAGTPAHMAPEILGRSEYDTSVDIWSLGSVVFELIMRHPLFAADTVQSLLNQHGRLQEICNELRNESTKMGYSVELVELLCQMLQPDPDYRITAAGILDHPFISLHLPQYIEQQTDELRALNSLVDGGLARIPPTA